MEIRGRLDYVSENIKPCVALCMSGAVDTSKIKKAHLYSLNKRIW